MASYSHSAAAKHNASYAQGQTAAPGQPASFFLPGTKVQVGNHRVIVERYLSEGGFAHVYVVLIPTKDGRQEQAVLKRVAVPDKESLKSMRTEVETMKKLKGHKHIVTYIDSHASELMGGGYEVFLLMEFCSGGGLIDFMNTRLKNRLTEPEILQIFSDAAEGVACMHYLKPPLLHRDLKIENILITTDSKNNRLYKLCDFGSSAPPIPAARGMQEGALIEEDIQKHTTFQYRSPEMIDVYRKRPIDEKSDIWALGVFLYKLCYYTTPFEEVGQMAILTASYKYPAHPRFSDRLKRLIAIMLMEDPKRRPNIYEVMKETCSMRGKECPIKDIYSQRTESESRAYQKLPPRESDVKTPPTVGVSVTSSTQAAQAIPQVAPMRRGRPTTESLPNKPAIASANAAAAAAAAKKANDDPFAALDSKDYATRVAAVEKLSSKYPAVEDFSLLQTRDSKYQFKQGDSPVLPTRNDSLKQRFTNALADEAFGQTARVTSNPSPNTAPVVRSDASRPSGTTGSDRMTKALPVAPPKPPRPAMVSTGTMTGDSPPPTLPKPTLPAYPDYSDKPIWRVPEQKDRASRGLLSKLNPRPKLHGRSSSQSGQIRDDLPLSPSSSRPSLEARRPSLLDVPQPVQRSRSTDARDNRSTTLADTSDRSATSTPGMVDAERASGTVMEDLDFLRAVEDENGSSKKVGHRRRPSAIDNLRNLKHTSMPSVSRNILSGRLGDAFKLFEGGGGSSSSSPPERSSSKAAAATAQLADKSGLSTSPLLQAQDPIARPDSVALEDEGGYENFNTLDEMDEASLSPEVRRELERRRLSAVERRVSDRAAAWRATPGGPNASNRPSTNASAIQNRVRTLLDESSRASPVKRTAEGYGRYTESAAGVDASATTIGVASTGPASLKPTAMTSPPPPTTTQSRTNPQGLSVQTMPASSSSSLPSSSEKSTRLGQAIATTTTTSAPSRPNAPPKPVALRTGATPTTPSMPDNALRAVGSVEQQGGAVGNDEDWESDFSKRFPSLSLEMVDAEISSSSSSTQPAQRRDPVRIRDV